MSRDLFAEDGVLFDTGRVSPGIKNIFPGIIQAAEKCLPGLKTITASPFGHSISVPRSKMLQVFQPKENKRVCFHPHFNSHFQGMLEMRRFFMNDQLDFPHLLCLDSKMLNPWQLLEPQISQRQEKRWSWCHISLLSLNKLHNLCLTTYFTHRQEEQGELYELVRAGNSIISHDYYYKIFGKLTQ